MCRRRRDTKRATTFCRLVMKALVALLLFENLQICFATLVLGT